MPFFETSSNAHRRKPLGRMRSSTLTKAKCEWRGLFILRCPSRLGPWGWHLPSHTIHHPVVLLLPELSRKHVCPSLTHLELWAGAVPGLQGTGPGRRRPEHAECWPAWSPGPVDGEPQHTAVTQL